MSKVNINVCEHCREDHIPPQYGYARSCHQAYLKRIGAYVDCIHGDGQRPNYAMKAFWAGVAAVVLFIASSVMILLWGKI